MPWKPFRFFPSIFECEDRRPVSTFLGVADAFVADTASLSLEPQPPQLESLFESDFVADDPPDVSVEVVERPLAGAKIGSMLPVRANPAFVDQVFSSGSAISSNILADLDEPTLTHLATLGRPQLMAETPSFASNVAPVPSAGPQLPNGGSVSPPKLLPPQTDSDPFKSGGGSEPSGGSSGPVTSSEPGGGGEPLSPPGGGDWPIVTITATIPDAYEGVQAGQFTIIRSGDSTFEPPLRVFFAKSGTASVSDYNVGTYQPGYTDIPAGQASVTLPLIAWDDAEIEPDETVTVTLLDNTWYDLGIPFQATVTIHDNDPSGGGGGDQPTVSIATSDPNASEVNLDPGQFTVTRTGPTTDHLYVSYTVSGTATEAEDYEYLYGWLEIPAGAASATIAVSPLDDELVEPAESVIVTLSDDESYVIGTGTASVTITDDPNDQIPLVTIETAADGSEDGPADGEFVIRRTGSLIDPLTVHYSVGGTATPGYDYTPLNGTTPETGTLLWNNDGTFTYTPPIGFIGDVTFQYRANDGFEDSDPATVTLHVLPLVTVEPTDGSAAEELLDPGQFTFRRTGNTSQSLTVYYTVRDTAVSGTDYGALAGSLTIAAGSAEATLDATPFEDEFAELSQSIEVVLLEDSSYLLGDELNEAEVTLEDNDPGVIIRQSEGITDVEEDGYGDTYTVVLNTQPAGDVDVTISAPSNVRVAVTGAQPVSTLTLHFTDAEWNVPYTITVSAFDDGVAQGTIEAEITHQVVSADARFHGRATSSVFLQVKDNPAPPQPAERHTIEPNEVNRVKFIDPVRIEVDPTWKNTSLGDAIDGANWLYLNSISPNNIKGLSPANLNAFLGMLDYEGRAQYWTADGNTDWGNANLAVAIAGKMWASRDTEAFARVFSAIPTKVSPHLSDHGIKVLTQDQWLTRMSQDMQDRGAEAEDWTALQKIVQRNPEAQPASMVAAMLAVGLLPSRWKPLTKARLDQLWAAQHPGQPLDNRLIGNDFEAFALASLGEIRYGQTIPSPQRQAATLGTHRGVEPDALNSLTVYETSYYTMRIRDYPQSTFIEVKARANTSLAPSTDEHQITGYIDIAARSPARIAGQIPRVVFVTTSDTTVSPSVLALANASGVAVWQAWVFEDLSAAPGTSNLIVGPAIPLNLSLYVSRGTIPLPQAAGALGSLP